MHRENIGAAAILVVVKHRHLERDALFSPILGD